MGILENMVTSENMEDNIDVNAIKDIKRYLSILKSPYDKASRSFTFTSNIY